MLTVTHRQGMCWKQDKEGIEECGLQNRLWIFVFLEESESVRHSVLSNSL